MQSVLPVRLTYSAHRSDHTTSLFQQIHWLSVPECMDFKLCVSVYRCLHGLGPENLSSDVTLIADILSSLTALGRRLLCRGTHTHQASRVSSLSSFWQLLIFPFFPYAKPSCKMYSVVNKCPTLTLRLPSTASLISSLPCMFLN